MALVNLQRKVHALQAVVLGLTEPVQLASPPPALEPPTTDPKRLLAVCVAAYIAETAEHKSTKTLSTYARTVLDFCGCLTGISPKAKDLTREVFLAKIAATGKYIEDISREDILVFAAMMRKNGNAPRTIRNRVDFFQIFLHHFKLPSLLMGSDLPKYTTKKVRAYNEYELGLMFGHATQDESDLLHFLLCTGAREQEAQYVCWSDVDLERKTYTVTEHLDLGYRPKDREEGTVPIPDLLVDVLKARRKHYPKTRLIFPGKSGKSNGHALRAVKSLALRAGANCGQCVNKKGKSCTTHPVCRHILLHKMRNTFASTLHHNGLPAQTLQRYLRHSDLSTTLAYIADQPDEQVHETINATFNGFGRGAK